MRVVLDTNVVLSGLFWRGAPRAVLEAAAAGRIRALTSVPLLLELGEVGRDRFGLPPEECAELVSYLQSIAEVVEERARSSVRVRDPDDAMVVACALGGRAEAIVTGDRDLLVLEAVETVRILEPRELLDLLRRP